MIEQLAFKMAVSLKRSIPDHPSSVEIFKFSISLLLNMTFIIVLTLAVSILTGRTEEIMIILLSFAVLRQLTGGIHLKTNMQCVLYSTIIFTVISLLEVGKGITVGASLLALGLVFLFAPRGIDKQSRIPRKFYPYMKLAALMLVAANFIILSSVLAFSFLVQAITLIFGEKVKK